MSDKADLYERAKIVKAAHQEKLMRKANVVGVGIGYAQRNQKATGQLALVVMVTRKLPSDLLDTEDIIPGELEGVPVDVQVVGELRALG